jgi:hypothetical protein
LYGECIRPQCDVSNETFGGFKVVKLHTAQHQVRFLVYLVACFALASFAQTAHANLYEWTNSAGTIDVKADLSISGDTLTVQLSNVSSQPTAAPADALTSFYFDIAGDPALTYLSATGNVYLTHKNAPDVLQSFSTFRANNTPLGFIGDGRTNYGQGHADGWQFKTAVSFDYGIGTAGNSNLPVAGDRFYGNDVDGLDFAIITDDDVTTQNLDQKYLIREMATFTFGLPAGSSYTDADIGPVVAFGFGTKPDTFVQTPLPGAALLGFMGLGVAGLKLRRYA